MKRLASVLFVLAAVSGGAGCVGSLSDPDAFIDGGTPPKDAEMVFQESCGRSDCHDAVDPQAQLDLISPAVEDRVVDQDARTTGCESRKLVVAGDPDSSYLLDKVIPVPPICGGQMPVAETLSLDDIEVLRQWIIDLGGSGQETLDGG
jgi:hypothetical protein